MCMCGSIIWGGPQRGRLTGSRLSAISGLGLPVPTWELPCGRRGPPHQASASCSSVASWREKEEGARWRRVTPGTVWGLRFFTHQRHYYSLHFTRAETDAWRAWVPDQGWSPSNECYRRGSKLGSLAPTTHLSEEGLDLSSHLNVQMYPRRTLCCRGRASSLSSL